MSLCGRLKRLERDHAPRRPRVRLVALDHPPDGRTRVFLDDGTELPQGTDWRPFAVGGVYKVISGVDLDAELGRTMADDGSDAGRSDRAP